ncbi:hypothetical protein C5167_044582 [Papaver somniferum]|uniref:Pectinesterase catalytic domain-containing protein n=1 Tax=Papaver somniferum TaxID=3469 RepID=A0A4Y7L8Y1_PAPSO|nr:hypothetical protein C5167_044582 [Papaver somniferum]
MIIFSLQMTKLPKTALSILIFFSLIITTRTISTHDEERILKHTDTSLDTPLKNIKPDITVSQHGDGTFKTITEAIQAAPDLSDRSIVIYVKSGRYEEEDLQVGTKKTNIWLIGDGINKTVITGGKSVGGAGNLTTFQTASFTVKGYGFVARDLTFDNWAGPAKYQAVALLVSANRVVVYRCSITGYQDSLYAHKGTQFFRECDIYGTIDFICGDGTAVFQKCRIYARRPLEGQFNSWILAAPDLDPVKNTVKTYLGRPWDLYSRVVFMLCHMGDHTDPSGWSPWEQNDTRAFDTLYYGEYLNDGPGRAGNKRVNWTGFHNMTSQEAEGFTVNQFINGSIWLPSTGVPYTGGL